MFSDFVIYADESGDHNLSKIDPNFSVFALSLCVFEKRRYTREIVPRFQELKFKWFGHDAVVFHEREMRKQTPPFEWLSVRDKREAFFNDLEAALSAAGLRVFSAVIDKRRLSEDFFPENPYILSLRTCLEEIWTFHGWKRQLGKKLFFVFEKRGRREDNELELEFLRICSGENRHRVPFADFQILFVDKKANCTGLQIADLTARPIALSVFRPDQRNRAFEILNRDNAKRSRFARTLCSRQVFP